MSISSLRATLLIPLLFFASDPLSLQAAAPAANTGNITGRVQNAATGQYLNNARITVRGTDRQIFTDDSGTYWLPSVPAGAVVLDAFFTGLDPQEISLQLAPAQTLERNIDLTSVPRYGKQDGTRISTRSSARARTGA